MVTVNDAKQKIIANTALMPVENKKVWEAEGYVAAEDVISPLSLPSFRQSSMDGYAIHHEDLAGTGTVLPVAGEIKAGSRVKETLVRGTAVRIFTGAPVPDGATAVIMQEHTVADGGNIKISEYPVDGGKNIRNAGQQIRLGEVALPIGTVLTPGSIGFLTGMNVQEVQVYKKPRIGILVTGDELVKPGCELGYGQVYESNSAMLVAALRKEGITEITVRFTSDDLQSTIEALRSLAETTDLILASGGISVGDYDFVGRALDAIGAETVFYKVRQKPGKPLLFAKSEKNLFFALPGNPASSLVCYYEYVLPAIKKITGHQGYFLHKLRLPCAHAYTFNGERDEFLKAYATTENVIPLDGQESFALRSFALANALIYLPVTQQVVKKGDLVDVHLLPLR